MAGSDVAAEGSAGGEADDRDEVDHDRGHDEGDHGHGGVDDADEPVAGDVAGPDESGVEEATVGERSSGRGLSTRTRLVVVLVAVAGFWFLYNLLDVWLGSRADFGGDAQAAVVLGAAQYNGSPSAALAGRLDQAGQLYLDGRVELVVVTGGGQPADITTEAKTGYDYLRQTFGLPDEDLRLEVDGTSTYQSLAAVARFLDNEEIDRVILVTDPYHARRSQLVAEEVGLEAELVSTDAGFGVGRLVREAAATSAGRILGFRRVDAYLAP